MKYFLIGLIKLIFLPIFLIVELVLIHIDVICFLGGKSRLNLEDYYYVQLSKLYFKED